MIGVGLRAGHIEKIGMNRASFPLNVQNLACSVDSDGVKSRGEPCARLSGSSAVCRAAATPNLQANATHGAHMHMLFMRNGAQFQVEVCDRPPTSRRRPSVDVLFRFLPMLPATTSWALS